MPCPPRRRSRALSAGCALALGLAWSAATADPARVIAVPLRVDDAFLRARLVEQVFTEEGERTPAWLDASGCTKVVLSAPTLASRDGALQVGARFEATLGAGTGGFCLGAFQRQGLLDATLEPYVAPEFGRTRVGFRVARSELLDDDGVKRFTGAVWDALSGLVHPHFEALRLDLGPPVAELRAFLPALWPAADARAQRVLDSLALDDVVVQPGGLDVVVRFEAPGPAPRRRVEAPEPALSPEELARWEDAWQSWDAFLTFVTKRSLLPSDEATRLELEIALLEARYDLMEILASSEPGEADPVRPLFAKAWARFAPLLRRVSTGLPGEEAIHWATLIAAADAVTAVDALGPDFGFELSRDGLRRMARMIASTPGSDPTAWSEDVDPELRELFGFGAPLPAPEEPEDRPEPRGPEAEPVPPGDAPEDATDPSAFRRLPSLPSLPHPGWDVALVAASGGRELDAWVPTRNELDAYLERVRGVLEKAAVFVQRKKRMPGRLVPLFRALVLSTAWQETCWRQYVRDGGAVRTITSQAGAVGIMQVNPYVWRGFYDVASLRRNTRYNADAGAEILHHYLVDHAIEQGEDQVRGDPDDLARATYAAYNAGPRQLARYRRPGNAKGGTGHRVDAAFWSKFQAVRAGNELEVKSCYPGFSA